MMNHVDILWEDLSDSGKKKISEAIGIPIDHVPNETNWDICPVVTFDYYETTN